jgi:hypothetical protein
MTIDTKSLKERVKTGKGITISIEGIDYPAEFSPINFPENGAGIECYHSRFEV